MKKFFTSLFSLCLMVGLNAQTLTFKANTGDTDLDLTLNDMNVQAKADFKVFKQDMSVSFGVKEGKIDDLSVRLKMQPADIYMTLEVAKQSGKTVDAVAKSYESNKGKGWGVIAKEMGIKPGSPAFHAMKNSAKGKNKKMKENKGKGNGNPGKGNSGKGNGNGGGGKGKGKK